MAAPAKKSESKFTSKAVAKHQEAGKEIVPEWMKQDAGRGTEGLTEEDIGTPRLKLMQGLSPELDAHDGLSKGDFFHTMADVNLGASVRIVPVFRRTQFILWRPRGSGGGILARADDGKHWAPPDASFEVKLDDKDGGAVVVWKTAKTVAESGLGEWGSMNPKDPSSHPAATRMYNIVCAFPDHPDLMPAVYTFQRAGIPDAKTLHQKFKAKRDIPIFGQVYEFTSALRSNKKGDKFHGVTITPAGLVADQVEYKQYKAMFETFEQMGMRIRDEDSLQGEGDDMGDAGRPEGSPDY